MGDTKTKYQTHTFSSGATVKIRPVSAALAYALQDNVPGKPEMPTVPVVNVAEKGEPPIMEPNPDHPYFKWQMEQYEKQYAEWQQRGNMRTVRFIIDKGVVDDPPENWEQDYAEYLPPADKLTKGLIKYYWVLSLMVDPAEMETFTEKLASQTMPTAKGIEQSIDTFHADGERDVTREPVRDAKPT